MKEETGVPRETPPITFFFGGGGGGGMKEETGVPRETPPITRFKKKNRYHIIIPDENPSPPNGDRTLTPSKPGDTVRLARTRRLSLTR